MDNEHHQHYGLACKLAKEMEAFIPKTFKMWSKEDMKIRLEQQDCDIITVEWALGGIDVGYPLMASLMKNGRTVPGYRVWAGEDDTIAELVSLHAALGEVVQMVVMYEMQNYSDSTLADEYAEDQRLAEQVWD